MKLGGGGEDFSPVFPNLPDASQKSIITVLNQAKPGALYLMPPTQMCGGIHHPFHSHGP